MKVIVNENKSIQVEEVFNAIVLKTPDGNTMSICMRDNGFEFEYKGEMYFAKDGVVSPFRKSDRGNYYVDQYPTADIDLLTLANPL